MQENAFAQLKEGGKDYYERKCKPLVSLLGDLDVNELSRDTVQEYINRRLEDIVEGRTKAPGPHTVSKELRTLRKALDIAKARGKLTAEPGGLIPKFKANYIPRVRHLTLGEYRSLRAALAPIGDEDTKADRQLWLDTACYSGQRAKELKTMTWEWVDFPARLIHVNGTKTRLSKRDVPLDSYLFDELAKRKADLEEDGTRVTGRVFKSWTKSNRDIHLACERAGIDRCSPNDFRRTFASWLKEAGADSAYVAKLLGHASTKMVDEIYGKISTEALRGVIALLPH